MTNLRAKYELLKMYKELVDECIKRNLPDAAAHGLERIKEIKKDIRTRNKVKNIYRDYIYSEIVGYGGRDDSGWVKIFFPNQRWTDETKREFIEDNWRYAKPSQYDCTGQIFTWAIDVFNVPSGVVAYIREAIDV